MLALVKTERGVGHLQLMERPEPTAGPRDVVIEVAAAGICGTDLHILHDEFPYWPPVIMGHEFSGTIVEVGSEVRGWRAGDRVVAEPHAGACGECYLCRTGKIQICAAKRSPGWGIDGAFARFVRMPAALLHRVPDQVSFESAAVAEPLAVVIHEALERGGVEVGDTVVVFGVGPIGLLAAAAARVAGASRVYVVGTDKDVEGRFPVAQRIPVDGVLNVNREDVIEKVTEVTGGRGADVVIEASGAPPAIAMTVELVRKGGRIAAIGLPGKAPVAFPWEKAMFKVCDLRFNLSSSFTSWEKAVAVMGAGQLDPGFVVSHSLPLERWEEAFRLAESGGALKVLLLPTAARTTEG